jgi:hypothetical protein
MRDGVRLNATNDAQQLRRNRSIVFRKYAVIFNIAPLGGSTRCDEC